MSAHIPTSAALSLPVLGALLLGGCGDYLYVKGSPGEDTENDCEEVTTTWGGDSVDLTEVTLLRQYALDGLLARHLQAAGSTEETSRFDYGAIVASAEATLSLELSLSTLSGVSPTNLQDADERQAYWLNTYNTWVIWAVTAQLGEDPDYDSVSANEWALFNSAFIPVEDFLLSPNLVEHGVLRGDEWALENYVDSSQDGLLEAVEQWHQQTWDGAVVDARIHMGLNCASLSCPDLPARPFQGDEIDEQLGAASVAFVDNATKGAGPNGVSAIFSWFSDDFVSAFGSVEDFVATYRTDGIDDVDFETTLEYDWDLNGVSR